MICLYKQGPAVVTGRSPLVLVLLGGDESGSGLAAGQLERCLLVGHLDRGSAPDMFFFLALN